MGLAAEKPANYDDLFSLPDNMVGQIVHGVLHAHPRPAGPHASATSVLGMDIGSMFQRGRGGPGGWIIVDEPELHLGGHILVPDLAGWRRERMPSIPNAAHFELAPDWVCEVVSPSTARLDRVQKLPIYAQQGVSHCWLIDPRARTLEVFALRDSHWLLLSTYSEDDLVRAEPFDAAELELGALWADVEPEPEPQR